MPDYDGPSTWPPGNGARLGDGLTLEDVARTMREIPKLPTVKLQARPEWVELLRAKLPKTERDPMGEHVARIVAPGMFDVPIEEVPALPFRWSLRIGDLVIVETLDGQIYEREINMAAPVLDFSIPPLDPGPPEPFQITPRYQSPPITWYGAPAFIPTPKPSTRAQRRRLARLVSNFRRGRRASKGWRKHVRRMKAARRRGALK